MKLPIGYDNFREIIDKKLNFVDKSLFIKEIIDDCETKIAVITRPRRFGKTLNMSMLQHFLAAEVDGRSTKGLFDNLKIANVDQGEYLKKYQGQYPVIFISLKDIKKLNFADAIEGFRFFAQELYRAHRGILKSDNLQSDEKELFAKFLTNSAGRGELEKSLKILSEFLYKCYGVKPYLLIDEYDSPIHASFQYGYYEKMIDFMRNLFGAALKGNVYVEKAVVTGILRVAKESLFSGLNNVKVYSLLNTKYSQYFGFTEDEVDELLQQAELTAQAKEIKRWYNGYQFGETVIYNPWSIANCLNDNGKLQPYWINTSDNALIKQLFATADKPTKIRLESLIRNEPIKAMIDEYVTFINFNMTPSAIWSLLLSSGYLKATSCERTDDKLSCVLLPPNYEVYLVYRTMVKDWLTDHIGYEQYSDFLDSLLKGNIIDFTKMLKKYMVETFSVFDITGKNPEKFYHGFVLGLISSTMNTHVIKSNRESGYGRYDVLVIPKDLKPDAVGLIMEFKIADDCDGDLKASAQLALQQIKNRNYEAEMKQIGVSKIIKVGLAFWEKTVEVVYE
jgi:hypothetical protein